MKYAKRFTVILASIFIFLGTLVVEVSSQARGKFVRRPIIVRHIWRDPFWHARSWYDLWYDPYFYDPYRREQRERYYKEKDVKDTAKKIAKDREKFREDGVITAKEQEKLLKRQRDYAKAIEKLEKFNRDSD